MGEVRQKLFEDAARRYVSFYLEHMRVEEEVILPVAESLFNAADWKALRPLGGKLGIYPRVVCA